MSFYTAFKNVPLTVVKSAPKKVLPKNRLFWLSIGRKVFWIKIKFTFFKSV
jgi:hypothetical protein